MQDGKPKLKVAEEKEKKLERPATLEDMYSGLMNLRQTGKLAPFTVTQRIGDRIFHLTILDFSVTDAPPEDKE